jgi:transcription initiation factor IIE alpha subunit
VPERYEESITILENIKDLSKIIVTELLNALQAKDRARNFFCPELQYKYT